jgi:hypothetical protein
MTPRAQELFNLAKELEQRGGLVDWRAVAKRLASAFAALEHDISSGFVREGLVPGSIDEFHGRKPPDACE